MTAPRHIAVIDVGKSNAKLALVDRESLAEIDVATRPNRPLPAPPWLHFDTEGHWSFLLDALADFHRRHRVDAISVTTHGACAVLLDDAGGLAAPVLDYEDPGPDSTAAAYDALRPPFAETGSPRLARGLNLGAQLHWQFHTDPSLYARARRILTYPQYWGFRLTGVAATDVTSLGCHTDLWNPQAGAFSSLVDRLGIRDRIATARRSTDILGPILPELAAATGLAAGTPVACGIHDSNASLFPHLISRPAPFAVVSTGTWVVVMAVGGRKVALDPGRDTLINVSALGQPVPSARFMGGREYEIVRQGHPDVACEDDARQVLAQGLMLLPAVVPDTGPFQGRPMRWLPADPAAGSGPREVALAYYLALMTAECLGIVGAAGEIIVEGPFAKNRAYLRMLGAAASRPVIAAASATGTSLGAALLFDRRVAAPAAAPPPAPPSDDLQRYARAWRARVLP